MDTFGIGGIKLSKELFQLRFGTAVLRMNQEFLFYRNLADLGINIQILAGISIEGRIYATCCIASEVQEQVTALLTSMGLLNDQVELISSVGLISFYPHRFSLKILGRALDAFGNSSLPIYGVVSSISSITFITEYARLTEAQEVLNEFLAFSR